MHDQFRVGVRAHRDLGGRFEGADEGRDLVAGETLAGGLDAVRSLLERVVPREDAAQRREDRGRGCRDE